MNLEQTNWPHAAEDDSSYENPVYHAALGETDLLHFNDTSSDDDEKNENSENYPPTFRCTRSNEEIQKWIDKQRSPRVLIFGRRGAGKSSLLNYLLNNGMEDKNRLKTDCVGLVKPDGKWHKIYLKDHLRFQDDGQGEIAKNLFIEVKEIRGAGSKDGITPEEIELFKNELKNESADNFIADIVLYVCPANEVDSYAKDDVQMLETIFELWEEGKVPSLIIALSKCDLLDPQRYDLHDHKEKIIPVYDNSKSSKSEECGSKRCVPTVRWQPRKGVEDERIKKKIENMNLAVDKILEYVNSTKGLKSTVIVPVVSQCDDYLDLRWNIEELMQFLFDYMPDEVMLAAAVSMNNAKIWEKISERIEATFKQTKSWSRIKRIIIGATIVIGAVGLGVILFYFIPPLLATVGPVCEYLCCIGLEGVVAASIGGGTGLAVVTTAYGIYQGVSWGRIKMSEKLKQECLQQLKDAFETMFKKFQLDNYLHCKDAIEYLFWKSVTHCAATANGVRHLFTGKSVMNTFSQYCGEHFGEKHNISMKVKRCLNPIAQ